MHTWASSWKTSMINIYFRCPNDKKCSELLCHVIIYALICLFMNANLAWYNCSNFMREINAKKMHRKMVIYHSKCWPSKLATSFKNETLHDKFNKMTCVPSLIRVFIVRSMDSQRPKVSLCEQQMHRLIWIFAGHTSHFCWFCHAVAKIIQNTKRYLAFSHRSEHSWNKVIIWVVRCWCKLFQAMTRPVLDIC